MQPRDPKVRCRRITKYHAMEYLVEDFYAKANEQVERKEGKMGEDGELHKVPFTFSRPMSMLLDRVIQRSADEFKLALRLKNSRMIQQLNPCTLDRAIGIFKNILSDK